MHFLAILLSFVLMRRRVLKHVVWLEKYSIFKPENWISFVLLYKVSRAFQVVQRWKNPPANAGNVGLTPGLRRSPGRENGNLLRYSCLANLMDRVAGWAAVLGSQRVGHDWGTATQQQSILIWPNRMTSVGFIFFSCKEKKIGN